VGTRVIGIDLGQRRIGVAVSDSKRILATPYSVITRGSDPESDRRAIADLASELGAGLVVIGLPLTLAGQRGVAAAAAEVEARAIASELDVPVVLHDERLTTVEAERRRRPPSKLVKARSNERARRQESSRAGSRARREPIDAVAATVLLQSWLDSQAGQA